MIHFRRAGPAALVIRCFTPQNQQKEGYPAETGYGKAS